MITPEEYGKRWQNPQELIRYNAAVVDNLPISEVSKTFLIEAGLPKIAMGVAHFDLPPNNFPFLPESITEFQFPTDYSRYQLLGLEICPYIQDRREINRFFCSDKENKDAIIHIMKPYPDTTIPFPVFFGNTSVIHMADMFLIWEENHYWLRQWAADHPNYEKEEDDDISIAHELEIQNHFREVGAKLRQVDPEALEKDSF